MYGENLLIRFLIFSQVARAAIPILDCRFIILVFIQVKIQPVPVCFHCEHLNAFYNGLSGFINNKLSIGHFDTLIDKFYNSPFNKILSTSKLYYSDSQTLLKRR